MLTPSILYIEMIVKKELGNMKDIFNKRQRFSIRKFSVGAASVLIGVALFAPTQGVLASTENNDKSGIEVNSEIDNSLPTVRSKKKFKVSQNIETMLLLR